MSIIQKRVNAKHKFSLISREKALRQEFFGAGGAVSDLWMLLATVTLLPTKFGRYLSQTSEAKENKNPKHGAFRK